MVKFLTKKFLLVPTLLVVGVIETVVPGLINSLPQGLSDALFNGVFGTGAAEVVNHLLDFIDNKVTPA